MATTYTDPSVFESRGNTDESDPRVGNNFIPNEDLGEPPSSRLVRAPADADAIDGGEDGTVCFACAYTKVDTCQSADPFNEGEVKDAYEDMLKLIEDHYASGVSNPHVVNMVYDFYEKEIRPLGEFGEWTKRSIARHLLYHTNSEDVLAQEVTSMMYAQIQSIRNRTWVENIHDGTLEPHHKNIMLMERLIKGLGDHLAKKRIKK
jgi:hypothetical protein